MTPEQLANLHARASASPWSAASFAQQLNYPGAILEFTEHAFAFGRCLFEEAELLQIATDPNFQKQGLGRQVLTAFEHEAFKRGCTRAILDVAESNTSARTLYTTSGWQVDGRRKSYYPRIDGGREDALLMSKAL
ncbi:MAG: GNAT family N-acetyltransferase [Planktotalea sp.]|uniref:GNAT family N-acetyltransferase n=1 Tax=Planktotalea sp. TaxID=2029877 RepID=UPI003C74C844